MLKRNYIGLLLICLTLISFTTLSSAETWKYNYLPEGLTFNNNTAFVNSSNYWNTNIGDLDNVNSTQFENSGGQLHLLDSWLTTFINSFNFLLKTGDSTTGDYNFSDTLFVDSVNKRVGIGTTTPQNKLNIVGATNSTSGFIVGANVGITGNYTNGNCWTAYLGGIVYGTNCTAA